MVRSLLLAALLTVVVTLPVQAQWIPNPAFGSEYRLTAERYWGIADEYPNDNQPTWTQAEAEAVSYGGHLVTINEAAENQWLADTFGPTFRWIGFTDLGTEGTWRWISGEPVTYTNWDNGQPDNGEGGEDCAHINHSRPGVWNDLGNRALPHHPDLPYYGIVERPLPTPIEACTWGRIKETLR